ncbi:hypothetical protein SAMN05192559_106267 [Halobacillus karajensis]|uniref:Uncharacterized protein n=1 Tax=Halobacillus karajensis TaxID=195088 RepID=A0A024P783_9BACI|nr:hypothetical protein BN982_03291 [Halobacillus karajensis]CDQ25004.1 hypothetical protein BN983_03306 [Halobacillus karajensis]CDQ28635.1 hypothetical protein BN981_02946 [Halobacillus karajensis]SEH98397.1 hypothetical protein SAMN05192559_106267 [Halobacillus karajensis]
MIWFRMIMIAMFSVTALSLLSYQGTEIYHAFLEFFNKE